MQSTAFDPSPGFLGMAAAPPHSELGVRPGQPFSWPAWYGMRTRPCKTFVSAPFCGVESDMWTMARALIDPSHTVLELGARYGTTSCVLAEATNNSGRVVSVEPDSFVHAALDTNRRAHKCNFGIFRGTVGRHAQVLEATYASGSRKTYEVRTRDARSTDAPSTHLASISVDDLERLSGMRFNAMVIDCEGCLNGVLDHQLLRRTVPPLELLLIEQDSLRKVNYAEWHVQLVRHGFRRLWRVEDVIFGNRGTKHVAYHRGERRVPTCHEYAKQQQRQRGYPRCSESKQGSIKCGSRLTCLPADVVNRSSEQVWIMKSESKLRARMRASGNLSHFL